MQLDHPTMTRIAVAWLRRPHSRGGHGCHIALSECWSGFSGERPDAIGFRVGGHNDGSVVVEVKTNRSDYQRDANKPHRLPGAAALGNWRYYMCPQGVIGVDDLPERWGLLHVTPRGHVRVVKGAYAVTHYAKRQQALTDMRFESNSDRERYILVRLLLACGDIQEARSKQQNLYREIDSLRRQLARADAKSPPSKTLLSAPIPRS